MYKVAWFLFLLSAIVIGITSCLSCSSMAINSPEVLHIRKHVAYDDLTKQELRILEDIMIIALESNRKNYYFDKLELLLDTITNSPQVTRDINNERINNSVVESKKIRRETAKNSQQDLEEYMNQEEVYEHREGLTWLGYRPNSNGPYFYVSHDNYDDILVHIRVRLHGNYDMIEKILSFEDAIEKHLSVPGFSVNLVFVGNPGEDVFDVLTDPSEWVSSYNWSGGYKVLAHELMHLMGLPDEYNRIEAHAGNKNMSRIQRLLQFKAQMNDEIPEDSSDGIMCFYTLKPLERHVCAAVGLIDGSCVKVRNKEFH